MVWGSAVTAVQEMLGYMYETGRAGQLGGDKEAGKWYRKAALAGSAAGELNRGLAFLNGAGLRQDMQEAMRWFREAAARGSGAACDQLGRAYQHGWGVDRDSAVAEGWYRAW